jgi:hypothetical protein
MNEKSLKRLGFLKLNNYMGSEYRLSIQGTPIVIIILGLSSVLIYNKETEVVIGDLALDNALQVYNLINFIKESF